MTAPVRYLSSLCEAIARGWSEFWFRSSDPLTLCVIRILAGLVACYYVTSFTSDLTVWFAPDGILSVETMRRFSGDDEAFRPSLLNYLDSDLLLYAGHFLGLLVCALFTIGLATRVSGVLTLLVVLSYVHRAPLVTGLTEPVLTMVLLYLCVAPAGARLSVDRWIRDRRASGFTPQVLASPWANIAQRLMQVHLAGFYLMFGLNKLAAPTWWAGDAVWWLMARPESRLVDLTFLGERTYVYNFWTHAIVAFELAFAVLIWNRWARPMLLILAVPMWISLALVTGQVAFCLMMLVANCCFVAPDEMRKLLGLRFGNADPQDRGLAPNG